MNKEQILNAKTGTPEEREAFSRLAGEVLQPEKGAHVFYHKGVWLKYCKKCGKGFAKANSDDCHGVKKVPLTWPEAMKYFNLMYEKHGKAKIIEAMKQVYVSATGDTNGADYVLDWWPFNAGLEGNLKAAAICEINNA